MATAPTSKKIQRVQQSGVTRRVGQRRPLGFPAAVAGIIIVGLILVLLARDARQHVNGEEPRPNQDKWYEAYGFYLCDAYEANIPTPTNESDISTQGNGLINIFPLSAATAGDNATLGKFFEGVDMKVTNSKLTLPNGTTHAEGESCGAGKSKTKDTELKLFIWPPQASNKTKPEIVTEDFGSIRFAQDKGAYALALVPKGTKKIDLPPSVGNLDDPEGTAVPAATAPTTTAEPSGSTTVAPSTTTAPSTTVAPTTTKG